MNTRCPPKRVPSSRPLFFTLQTHHAATQELQRRRTTAYRGHLGVVRLLLSQGAEPGTCDDDGSTPLHKAAGQGRVEVCKVLLQRCPELRNLQDKRTRTPWELAEDREGLRDLLKPHSERADTQPLRAALSPD
ncbi:UNVERIFIED_CONTAM: hypothetical protein FKN15_034740 [Acipenser sinensis]